MLKKTLVLATGLTAALGFSSGAFADPPHWAPAHGWRAKHKHHGHYYAPRPVYVVPAPRVVYAAPPAPVYYPAPEYYPAPVYGPAPVISPYGGAPSISIRLNLPL